MLFVCNKEPEYIQILSRYCYFLIKIPLAVGSSPSSQGNYIQFTGNDQFHSPQRHFVILNPNFIIIFKVLIDVFLSYSFSASGKSS